jgi:hypothetical protein
MAAGQITIDLLMRTGSFETDSKRAQKALRDLNRESVEFAKGAAIALLGLAGTASAAFLALERGASAIGKFKDLGDVIGDTGEAVASLQSAADVSGTAMDSVTAASVRLTAALSKTDDESKGAGAALKLLNLPLEEFKRLAPVEQLNAVAKALDGVGNASDRTAIAVALFGKAGAQLLPFLRELNSQGGPRVIITQDQIDAADRFSDSVGLLKSQVTQLGQSVLADLLPPFQAFVDEIGQADRALSIFEVAGSAVRVFFETITVLGANVIFVFKGIGTEIGGIAAQMAALARFDFQGFNAISKAIKEDAAKARAELDRFEQRILGATANEALTRRQRSVEDRGFDPLKQQRLDLSGLGGTADDPTKKLLDNRIKALESAVQREQSLLGERNRFLDIFNSQGLLSIRSYYDAQLAIIEAATTAQTAAINKQIALTTQARDSATKQTDRADQQGKLDTLIEKRSRLEQESGLKVIELTIRREEAERRFAQQIESTRASVLELQGNLSAAAAIRFDIQNQELLKKADAERNEELKALLDTLKKASVEQAKFAEGADFRNLNAQLLELQGNLGAAAAIRFDEQNFALIQRALKPGNEELLRLVGSLRQATIAQAEFGRATADTQRVIDSLAIAEDRIAISRQLGATTELGALTQLGQARRAALVQLEAQVQAQEAIAKASGNPALVQQAERARVELERLAATADPLADKFRGIFEGSFGDALGDFATGAKTAKEAFNDFANSVADQIARLAAQNLAQSLFGKDGAFGGIGAAFGGLFGGGSGADAGGAAVKASADTAAASATTALAASATAASTGLTVLPAAVPPTVSALTTLAVSAELAASALQAIATQKATEGAGEFVIGSISAFAGGGAPPVGKVSVGGEFGTELFLEASRNPVANLTGAALIGSNGPQFFRPQVPGIVIPADETERILRGFGGFFAGGGMPPLGLTSMGGEDDEELFIPITRGRQPPRSNERNSRSSGMNQTNNFIVRGPVDRSTEQQIAIKAAQAAQRALARGNA